MRPSCRRAGVHAFIRPPHPRSIPNANSTGIVINREMLTRQFRDFFRTLQQSTLIDKLHVMSERSQFESTRAADQLACIGSTFLGMPMAGNEHRATEFIETMRYVRAAGGPTSVTTMLQDAENCRCSSGDIVMVPNGIVVGHGARTNAVAHQLLKQHFQVQDESAPFDVVTLEQEGDAPPLGDYFNFAGSDTLVAWKDEHGMLAVDQYQQHRSGAPLQTVYLEPGCHFLTFFGADQTNDVLVQRGFDRSIEALRGVGLNPIPVQWSEMDKLGVSMRAAVLVMHFLKTNVQGMIARNRVRGSRWQGHQLESSSRVTPVPPPAPPS